MLAMIAAMLIAWWGIWLFNQLPQTWFCDYGAEPGLNLIGKRLNWHFWWPGLTILMWQTISISLKLYGWSIYFFSIIAIVWIVSLCAVADYKYLILPDQGIVLLALLSLGISLPDQLGQALFHQGWLSPIWGALIGGGSFWLLGSIASYCLKKPSLGFGDVKLLAVAGLIIGYPWILWLLVITVVSAGIHFLTLMLIGRLQWGQAYPLGPYICIALIIVLLFPDFLHRVFIWYSLLLT